MKKILSLLALLVYLPASIHTSKVMSQEVAEDDWYIACKSGSTDDYISEVSLISTINKVRINAEEGVKNLTDIELELKNYSIQVDRTGKVLTFLVNDWDGTIRSMAEGFVSEMADIPGVEIKKLKIKTDTVKALEKILTVFDTLSPSNIADWITQTSSTIANAKLQITSNAAQNSTILSKKLKTLRDKCEGKAVPPKKTQSTTPTESNPNSNANNLIKGVCELIEPAHLEIFSDTRTVPSRLVLQNQNTERIADIWEYTGGRGYSTTTISPNTGIRDNDYYPTSSTTSIVGFHVKPGVDQRIARDRVKSFHSTFTNVNDTSSYTEAFNRLMNLPCVLPIVRQTIVE